MSKRNSDIKYIGHLGAKSDTSFNNQLTFTSIRGAAQYLREHGDNGDILTLRQLRFALPALDPAHTLTEEDFRWTTDIVLTYGPRGGISGGGL